jgi:cell wall-associated NlpC family hydrolase
MGTRTITELVLMPAKASYLLLAGGGAVLLYSGIRGKSATGILHNLIGGQSPAQAAEANALYGIAPNVANPLAPGGTANGNAIAMDALQWKGHGYVYGGPSNPNGGWDCSSFVSWILGHDFGLQLPGGTWAQVTSNGSAHGPVAAQYLVWSGASTVSGNSIQSGDLLCWQTHVGFAADSTHMISAYDNQLGTALTPIQGAGPGGEIMVVRRVKGT